MASFETSSLKLDHCEKYKPGVVTLPVPPLELLGFRMVQALCGRSLDWFSRERWNGLYEGYDGYDVKLVGAYVYTSLKPSKAIESQDEALKALLWRPCPWSMDSSADLPEMEEWQTLDIPEGSSCPGLLGRKGGSPL